ncbi:unnamed protein product [Plutella xylostella]|uniref:(diamondback moth) hypothetical protein n=1 Tax=Plutella xylostella TaxID=51655 RepID=A0A8S4EBV1_PLUXY|nr:unnamed protein product [Plutella xylostella]
MSELKLKWGCCNQGKEGDKFIKCSRCNNIFHPECLIETFIDKYDVWICSLCMSLKPKGGKRDDTPVHPATPSEQEKGVTKRSKKRFAPSSSPESASQQSPLSHEDIDVQIVEQDKLKSNKDGKKFNYYKADYASIKKVLDNIVWELSLEVDESYELIIKPVDDDVINASVTANTFFGVRHGLESLETLSQLIIYDEIRDHLLIVRGERGADRSVRALRDAEDPRAAPHSAELAKHATKVHSALARDATLDAALLTPPCGPWAPRTRASPGSRHTTSGYRLYHLF